MKRLYIELCEYKGKKFGVECRPYIACDIGRLAGDCSSWSVGVVSYHQENVIDNCSLLHKLLAHVLTRQLNFKPGKGVTRTKNWHNKLLFTNTPENFHCSLWYKELKKYAVAEDVSTVQSWRGMPLDFRILSFPKLVDQQKAVELPFSDFTATFTKAGTVYPVEDVVKKNERLLREW